MALIVEALDPVRVAAQEGLLASPKALSPWLFYDERGSELFEQITALPEYYLTRTERALLERHSPEIVALCGASTIVELGAGTASKTGIVLGAAAETWGEVLYQPIDVSASALDAARQALEAKLPGVRVDAQIANYVTDPLRIEREPGRRVLALYIGSSIGNFSPDEAHTILGGLRMALRTGDHLLLGTDLAPTPIGKTTGELLAAYDDAQGVTAEFNRNVLVRLNRELGTDFRLDCFAHRALWNAAESRIEMHLESLGRQFVRLPAGPAGRAIALELAEGETIHTENSYKFTPGSVAALLERSGFAPAKTYTDTRGFFAVTLAEAV